MRRDPTKAYLASFVALGMTANLLGPGLTILRHQVHASVGAIGRLFVLTSVGYLIGSVLAGRGYDRSLGHRLYAGSLGLVAVSVLAVAYVGSFVAMMITFFVMGVAMSCTDLGGNTLMMWQRRGNVGPYMNALHFSFGIGSLLTPLLVNRSVAWSGDLRIACGVIVALSLGVGVWVASTAAPVHVAVGAGDADAETRSPELRSSEGCGSSDVRSTDTGPLALVAGFFVLYVGLELGFAGWIHTYAEEVHLGSANVVSAVTTVFWAAFTVGRLVAV